ncbi:Kinase [Hexamita inflata]|uniref:CMGC DYRK n=1 Tax=Hexamita inflata TaxID=28002 RepID=A0AA86TT80_9EUKA|nr:CMGC DYRK [Hexamita inflata]CAI9925625.1 CMGC DYRK [Hexamita inflata]CAI9966769.1 CMGC DYRK [Hexamita inflata]
MNDISMYTSLTQKMNMNLFGGVKRPLTQLTLNITHVYHNVQKRLQEEAPIEPLVDEQGYIILPIGYVTYNYVVVQMIHKGAQAVIYEVKNRDTNQAYILKIARIQRHFQLQTQAEHSFYNLLQQISSQIAPELIQSFSIQNSRALLLQKFEISLKQLLQLTNNRGLPLQYMKLVTAQFAHLLNLFQQFNFIHGDMRLENFVLNTDSPAELRIIDFGCSTINNTANYAHAHLWYRAPEQLFLLPISHKIDSFAVGCMLYELHTGKPLFCPNGEFQLAKQLFQILDLSSTPLYSNPITSQNSVNPLQSRSIDPQYPTSKSHLQSKSLDTSLPLQSKSHSQPLPLSNQFTAPFNALDFERFKTAFRTCGSNEHSKTLPTKETAEEFSVYDQIVRETRKTGKELVKYLIVNKEFLNQVGHGMLEYEQFSELINGLIDVDVEKRFGWKEIMESKFME